MNENEDYDKPRPVRDHNNKKRKPGLPDKEIRHPLHQPYRRPTRKDWMEEADD